jgi:serine phosphatase RsbU (regulator of sigma subunit)
MQTLSINYENKCQLLQFSTSDEFREYSQKSKLLIIQISTDVSDSYTISKVVNDLRIVFPWAKITGTYQENRDRNIGWTNRKTRLFFTFSEADEIETVINIVNAQQYSDENTDGNEELKFLYEQLREKNQLIDSFNQKITDSLIYAGRIQKAVIPPKEFIDRIFPQNFIIYQPKQYVSGDFYWFFEKGNITCWAVADCTGHGVPGALMSILGTTCLNEIGNLFTSCSIISASDILNLLRDMVKSSLHQTDNETKIKDGMDIALCVLDRESMKLQFAGAYNPLYLIRNKELIEFKGDKMPIGVHITEARPFTNHEIQLQTNDLLYLTTDGIADQFGGSAYKKFKARNLKNLLVANALEPLDVQHKVVKDTFDVWRNGYEQTDDITLLGLKITSYAQMNFSI